MAQPIDTAHLGVCWVVSLDAHQDEADLTDVTKPGRSHRSGTNPWQMKYPCPANAGNGGEAASWFSQIARECAPGPQGRLNRPPSTILPGVGRRRRPIDGQ